MTLNAELIKEVESTFERKERPDIFFVFDHDSSTQFRYIFHLVKSSFDKRYAIGLAIGPHLLLQKHLIDSRLDIAIKELDRAVAPQLTVEQEYSVRFCRTRFLIKENGRIIREVVLTDQIMRMLMAQEVLNEVKLGITPWLEALDYLEQAQGGPQEWMADRDYSYLLDAPKTIGDASCVNNAKSAYLRCAINPDGPCEGCKHFEVSQ